MAVLLGMLAASWHANEWMKLAIVGAPPFTVETMPEPNCAPDELIEEGLSLAECHQLAYSVHDISISSPDWFRGWHMLVSGIGTAVALFSIFVGLALVDRRGWAITSSIVVFGALALVDAASFIAVVYTGALVRQMYLWPILLWFALHMSMTVAAVVLRECRANDEIDRQDLQPRAINAE